MGEKNEVTEFSDAVFFELITNDPEALADYNKGLEDILNLKDYSEDEVIEIYTGKTKAEVFNEFTVPELNRMNWALDFLMDNPCGNLYIHKLITRNIMKKKGLL